MLNAAARGSSSSSHQQPCGDPMTHANSRCLLAGNPSGSYRCSCLHPGAFERRRPGIEPFSGVNSLKVLGVRSFFEFATQLIKVLYRLV